MKRTTVKELYSVRDNGSFAFISINDGSFFESLQIVVERERLGNYAEITAQNVGAALTFEGEIRLTPSARQPFELNASEAFVEGGSTPDYPLQKQRHSNEFLRTIAHLRPRTNLYSAVFRVRGLLAYAIHRFFNERGFVYIHTPIITTSDCEGAGEMFRVTTLDPASPPLTADGQADFSKDFFGKPAGLTVSGQLNAETHALALGSVYTFGPTFRAENSNTPRHGAEFWMVEPEMAFADLDDDAALAEDMLKYIISYVRENAPEEMALFNKFVDNGLSERLDAVVNSDFARVTYTEAVELLKGSGQKFEYPVDWGKWPFSINLLITA